MAKIDCAVCGNGCDEDLIDYCPDCISFICDECSSMYEGYCEDCFNEFAGHED